MKHSLKYLAATVGTGLLLLAACDKADVKLSQPGPATTLTQTVTQTDADAAFADLRQPNGKPISKHLAALVTLSIDAANRYQYFWNGLTKAEEQAERARMETLHQQPQTAEVFEQALHLSGYTGVQEYQAEAAKYAVERGLLEQDDSGYYQLSAQDQKAVRGLVLDHYRQFQLHKFLRPTNAKSSAGDKAPTSATNEDSPDDPWSGPDPSGDPDDQCFAAWLACRQTAEYNLSQALDLCGPLGTNSNFWCRQYAQLYFRNAMTACTFELFDCQANH